ncbi:mechanosensitive ion channel family protein [Gloeobacter morelensis]|uniref:Mechanosensitive ion channel family protein n=1 Tax=Gloeobacter morelensis MG652769 TaxID=2781736 RepID=A0ABY3PL07_9CYAN|nr:mechanosensitive ion channel family protein [Gloeobacter morelensis]UFP94367.1 mechanosensitive ion channel family protein [Gloeobacter morelensis MG652769]
MILNEIFDFPILGQTLLAWLVAVAVAIGVYGLLQAVRYLIGRRVEALPDGWGKLTGQLLEVTQPLFLAAVALYFGVQVLALPEFQARVLDGAVTIVALLQVGFWGNALFGHWFDNYRQSRAAGQGAATLGILSFLARLLLWSVLMLVALANLGFDITALVASLGIGGIAVGLAVQNILGDLFASLSIVLDKPFEVGDFIIVGELMGTVEYIGLKTTRVRSISGEQLIFANGDLVKNPIRNFKTLSERRVAFEIGVTYQTPAAKLEQVPTIVREIIESQPEVRFDRVHFKALADSALTFEIVYFVLSANYTLFMDIQQAINLALFKRFEREAIAFAYPTQTLFIDQAAANIAVRMLNANGLQSERSRQPSANGD